MYGVHNIFWKDNFVTKVPSKCCESVAVALYIPPTLLALDEIYIYIYIYRSYENPGDPLSVNGPPFNMLKIQMLLPLHTEANPTGTSMKPLVKAMKISHNNRKWNGGSKAAFGQL